MPLEPEGSKRDAVALLRGFFDDTTQPWERKSASLPRQVFVVMLRSLVQISRSWGALFFDFVNLLRAS